MFENIRKIVSQIPKGKVATYGQVAQLAGIADARKVGWALYGNQNSKIPCHRVIKKEGFLATGFSLGGWQRQKKLLESEGVEFESSRKVNFKSHLWQPENKNIIPCVDIEK
jgi:methylated-DNA-protein-cysteine methyltransferase-like protein